jgi:hypothetical protein
MGDEGINEIENLMCNENKENIPETNGDRFIPIRNTSFEYDLN